MSAYQIHYTAKVSDQGVLMGIPKRKLSDELKHFSGKDVELIIRRKKKYRSVEQNRLMWLWYGIMADHTGFTSDEIHSIMKSKFLHTEKVDEKTGVIYPYIRSTTELTTIEMIDYMTSIQKFASEDLQIVLPEPGDQLTIE